MREIDPNLLRAYFDRELPPQAAERVRAALEARPQWRRGLEFERNLKQAVGQTMSQAPPAPAALEAAIREAASESSVESPQPVGAAARPAAAPQGLLATVASWFEPIVRPRPISVGAVLAVLAIAAASVLFGIFFRPIDALSPNGGQPNFVSDPAEYASQEHDRCASNPDWMHRKVNFCSPDEAAVALMEHFGVDSVTIFDLTEAGYEFIGEGRCNLPETRHSAHLMYERQVEGKSRAKLSIFLAAAGESRPVTRCGVDLRPGEWHRFRDGSRCRKRVQLSTDNSLVYFLVTCDPADRDAVAELIGRTLAVRAK